MATKKQELSAFVVCSAHLARLAGCTITNRLDAEVAKARAGDTSGVTAAANELLWYGGAGTLKEQHVGWLIGTAIAYAASQGVGPATTCDLSAVANRLDRRDILVCLIADGTTPHKAARAAELLDTIEA